ncbi:ZIP family metal transporter [Natrinema sp. SYSU A 869]|uniref:ZIP family metal transporter n=1 Tax=Natrinema sp. SYSU A 869 TaxID=2871694 RepID=UPI001CA3E150|nr:ZIP family metal transporter [Natrinema sp. SYSU A 869]
MLSTGALRPDGVGLLVLAIILALVHLFAGRLGFGGRIPRSRWLSLAGGVSVAYVFVHLLPEVGAAAATLKEHGTPTAFAEQYGYLIALLGFVTFYGLERLARWTSTDPGLDDEPAGTGVFWIHVGSFAAYNSIVGYLLWDRELGSPLLFVTAMALHFLVTDDGLREHHGPTYHRRGRWVLSAAVLIGFAGGYVLEDTELLVSVCVPFLAGGIVLNVIKEELPSNRESGFWAFAIGAAGYAVLLLFV